MKRLSWLLSLLAVSLILPGISGCQRSGDSPEPAPAARVAQVSDAPPVARAPRRSSGSHGTPRVRPGGDTSTAADPRRPFAPLRSEARGRVTLPDGSPAADTEVTLWSQFEDSLTSLTWERVATTRTDADGRYNLSGRRGSDWGVSARRDGYAVAAYEDHRRMLHRGPGTVEFSADLRLQPERIIRGTVHLAAGDPPATILMHPQNEEDIFAAALVTTTAADGSYEMRGVGPEPFLAFAIADGYTPARKEIAGETIVNFPMKRGIDHTGRLSGEIKDFSAFDATVTLTSQYPMYLPLVRYRYQAHLLPDGTFKVPALPSLPYNISIDAEPLPIVMHNSDDTISGDTNSSTIHVTTGTIVTGTVVDEVTLKPLAGVCVYERTRGGNRLGETVTTASGEFRLAGYGNPQLIRVESATHYMAPDNRIPSIERDENNTSWTIKLQLMPLVYGVVTTANGEPPPPGTMVARFPGGSLYSTGNGVKVAPDGTFKIGLDTFQTRIGAQAPGYAPVFSEILEQKRDAGKHIVLTLGHGGARAGRVVDTQGTAVGGAAISAIAVTENQLSSGVNYDKNGHYYPGRAVAEILSKPDGSFVLENAPTNVDVLLVASHPRFKFPGLCGIKAYTTATDELVMTLPSVTTATVQLTSTDDRPVSSSRINFGCPMGTPPLLFKSMIATTGSRVTLAELPLNTTVTLQVHAEGFEPKEANVYFTGQVINLELTPKHVREFTVKFLDARTYQPADVTATLRGRTSGNIEPVAGRLGEYRLRVPQSSEYFLQLQSKEYDDDEIHIKDASVKSGEYTMLMRKSTATITGRAVDGETGAVIADANVELYNREHVTSKTASDGTFGPFPVHPDVRSVTLRKGNTKSEKVPIVNTDGPQDLGDIPLFGPMPVTVRVKEPSGEPVVGAKVIFGSSFEESRYFSILKTDARGEVHHQVELPAEHNEFGVYLPESRMFQLLGSVDRKVTTERVMEFTLGKGSITGKVVLPGGEKITGIDVEIKPKSGLLKNERKILSGDTFKFDNLPEGEYGFFVRGYVNKQHLIGLATVKLGVAENASIEIPLKPLKQGVGIFVKDEEGNPVPKASIILRDEKGGYVGSTTSNPDGYGGIFADRTGTFHAHVSHDDYGWAISDPITVKPDAETVFTRVTLQTYPGEITCTVLSVTDSLPVYTNAVSVVTEQGITIAGQDAAVAGDRRIPNIPPGKHQLKVHASGYQSHIEELEMKNGERKEITVVLIPASGLTVRPFNANGVTVSEGIVTVTAADGSAGPFTANVRDDGTASLQDLPPGTYNGTAVSGALRGSFTVKLPMYPDAKLDVIMK